MDVPHALGEGLWLGAAALGALLLWLATRAFGRAWQRGVRRRRMARAQRGEHAADQLLRELGYRIVGRQVRRQLVLEVDGEPLPVSLRADFLVQRGRQRLVAEVKTGVHAPRLQTANTRRQLLEYHLGFGADGALLVDMEQGRVRHVRFPRARGGVSVRAVLGWVLLGIAIGALAGWQLAASSRSSLELQLPHASG